MIFIQLSNSHGESAISVCRLDTCISVLVVMRSQLLSLILYKSTDSQLPYFPLTLLTHQAIHPLLSIFVLCSSDKDFETEFLEMRSFFVQTETCLFNPSIRHRNSKSYQYFSSGHTFQYLSSRPPLAKIPLILTFYPFYYKFWDIISHFQFVYV